MVEYLIKERMIVTISDEVIYDNSIDGDLKEIWINVKPWVVDDKRIVVRWYNIKGHIVVEDDIQYAILEGIIKINKFYQPCSNDNCYEVIIVKNTKHANIYNLKQLDPDCLIISDTEEEEVFDSNEYDDSFTDLFKDIPSPSSNKKPQKSIPTYNEKPQKSYYVNETRILALLETLNISINLGIISDRQHIWVDMKDYVHCSKLDDKPICHNLATEKITYHETFDIADCYMTTCITVDKHACCSSEDQYIIMYYKHDMVLEKLSD
jgi:hypothetical protein